MFDVSKVTNWARATYDEAPDPRSMLVILDAMWETLEQVAKARAVFTELGPLPGPLGVLDPDDALAPWDKEANQFYERMAAYYLQRAAMARGEVTGQYTAHVVAPVLYGEGYASPGQEVWSKVEWADVATPFSLANQLAARAENMGLLERVRDLLIMGPEVFANKIREGAKELGAAGATGATGAADVFEERAPKLVEDLGGSLASKASGAAMIFLAGGVALLVLRYLIVRK